MGLSNYPPGSDVPWAPWNLVECDECGDQMTKAELREHYEEGCDGPDEEEEDEDGDEN